MAVKLSEGGRFGGDVPMFRIAEETGIPQNRVYDIYRRLRAQDPNKTITIPDIQKSYKTWLTRRAEAEAERNKPPLSPLMQAPLPIEE
jgi:hypothetical protein